MMIAIYNFDNKDMTDVKIARDKAVPCLLYKKTPLGKPGYYFKTRYKLGCALTLTVAEARQLCINMLREGGKAEAYKISLEKLAGKVFKDMDHKSLSRYKRYIEKYTPEVLKKRKAYMIKTEDVRGLLSKIAVDHGESVANYYLKVLNVVYNRGCIKELAVANPAKTLRSYPMKRRSNFLVRAEVIKLLEALKHEDQSFSDYISLLIFTGARRGSVERMKYRDIDFDTGVWTISPEDSKTNVAMPIYLSTEALTIIRKNYADDREFVLPQEPFYPAWLKFRVKIGHPKLMQHDLRRTFASLLVENGTHPQAIAQALSHKSMKYLGSYMFASPSLVRDSVVVAQKGLRLEGCSANT